jgi:ATP-dependent RNA helicase DDX21
MASLKEPKASKKRKSVSEEAGAAEQKKEKKASKKRAKEEAAAAAAADSSDGAAASPPAKKSKKDSSSKKDGSAKKAAAAAPADAEPAAEEPPNPGALENFALSEGIKSLLRSKGIEALFPIQTACFAQVVAGADVVGRARTGCGKTLAFVLPIVQCLANEAAAAGSGGARGSKLPSVIVLAPTRELAKQVCLC